MFRKFRRVMSRTNNEPVSAVQYHDRTSHIRHRISPHSLDFSRYPAPFKSYDYHDRIFLNQAGRVRPDRGKNQILDDPEVTVGQVMAGQQGSDGKKTDLQRISKILHLAYGVTLADRSRGMLFRSVPSAGGLYPCQLYLSAHKSGDVETGLYYCDTVQGFLGSINPRPLDLGTIFPDRKVPDICLVITGIFFHSAWKYRERAFRYLLLDAGHLAEALVMAARLAGVQARICYDFDDRALMQELNLDPSLEVPLAGVFLGLRASAAPRPDVVPSQPAVAGPGQESPVVYEILSDIYEAGTRIAGKPVKRSHPPVFAGDPEREVPVPVPEQFPSVSFVRAVAGRRSRRHFVTRQLPASVWATFLNRVFHKMLTSHDPDETGAAAEPFVQTAMICQNLEGLPSGLYSFSRDGGALICRQTGALAENLARVCLDQTWIGRAAVNFLVVSDLAAVEAALGPRGYRYMMMHAGRIGQRVYLAAQEMGLGCCGIGAMYDYEACDLLGLIPGGRLLYALSAGPVK
jgi:SagB-type dehydrogenase family enzyme